MVVVVVVVSGKPRFRGATSTEFATRVKTRFVGKAAIPGDPAFPAMEAVEEGR